MHFSIKGEIVWAVYKNKGVPTHVIASTPLRDMYHLYEIKDGIPVRTKKKATNPIRLEEFILYIGGNE